ncbi:MAG: hypothetical protein HYS89_00430 [Candidatus Colwellbacteria bacterium]|nr:hypothetical protein [Candidatus Colwellbacteria bacterium]
MLTFFTIPKPFEGVIGTAQRNSISSWLAVHPGSEVIVFGNEKGASEAASELGFRHVKEIRRNKFGTPLVSEAFQVARNIAKYDHLVFINTDIILLNNLLEAAEQIRYPHYLMVGRRTDLNLKEEINFAPPDWKENLANRARREGRLHGFSGIDYFLFPKSLAPEMPPFPVSRPGWDSWFIYHIRSRKVPVIDATEVITAIHQKHPYTWSPSDPESLKSAEIAGGLANMSTIRDADFILTLQGLKKPPFIRHLLSTLSQLYAWRLVLALKRQILRALA